MYEIQKASSIPSIVSSFENIEAVERALTGIKAYNTRPYMKDTPKDKVKKKTGYDYVPNSFMSHEFKEFAPLYSHELINSFVDLGHVYCFVSVTDRITGNNELGAGAARIQVKKESDAMSVKDIVDMDNNVKSALTEAIKNAYSRFGICADVYKKREEERPDEFVQRFEDAVKNVPMEYRESYRKAWNELQYGYEEYIIRIETKYPPKETTKTTTSEPEQNYEIVDGIDKEKPKQFEGGRPKNSKVKKEEVKTETLPPQAETVISGFKSEVVEL